MAICNEFRTSRTHYLQHLDALLDGPEALACAPTTVERHQGLRETRRYDLSIRKLDGAEPRGFAIGAGHRA